MALMSPVCIDQARGAALLLAVLGSSFFGVVAPSQGIAVHVVEAGLPSCLGSDQWKGQEEVEEAFLLSLGPGLLWLVSLQLM